MSALDNLIARNELQRQMEALDKETRRLQREEEIRQFREDLVITSAGVVGGQLERIGRLIPGTYTVTFTQAEPSLKYENGTELQYAVRLSDLLIVRATVLIFGWVRGYTMSGGDHAQLFALDGREIKDNGGFLSAMRALRQREGS